MMDTYRNALIEIADVADVNVEKFLDSDDTKLRALCFSGLARVRKQAPEFLYEDLKFRLNRLDSEEWRGI